jgi:hypothetical protein
MLFPFASTRQDATRPVEAQGFVVRDPAHRTGSGRCLDLNLAVCPPPIAPTRKRWQTCARLQCCLRAIAIEVGRAGKMFLMIARSAE